MIRRDDTSLNQMAASTRHQEFAPAASLPLLRLRAEMLDWVRRFFRDRGYWEVETPILSHDVCVDAWLEPFCVPQGNGTSRAMYLQTSPEFGMKRILAAGAKSIYQITRAFRQEEAGRLHNPEFTIIEWYQVGDTYRSQMEFVAEFAAEFQTALSAFRTELADDFREAIPDVSPGKPMPLLSRPIRHMTYDGAFIRGWDQSVLGLATSELVRIARGRGIVAPKSLRDDDRDGWLNLLFLEVVEPMLAEQESVLIYDYPASQAALARIRPEDPPVAERFELYLQGVEICNGYQELIDPGELRRRIGEQSQKRQQAGRPTLPHESRLLSAMEAGLPSCAGVALGFDRLLMVLMGAASLEDVMAFPFDRA